MWVEDVLRFLVGEFVLVFFGVPEGVELCVDLLLVLLVLLYKPGDLAFVRRDFAVALAAADAGVRDLEDESLLEPLLTLDLPDVEDRPESWDRPEDLLEAIDVLEFKDTSLPHGESDFPRMWSEKAI